MKYFYITTLIFFLFIGCKEDDFQTFSTHKVTIYGSGVSCLNNTNSKVNNIYHLPEGAEIAFYAYDGIESTGQIMKLHRNYWESQKEISWKDRLHSANVKAYYPPLPTTAKELYHADGQLTDVLVAQDNYPPYSTIHLLFEHLFTKVNFQIDADFNNEIQKVTITPHITLTDLDPFQAQLNTTLSESMPSEEYHKVCYTNHTNGQYSIILPPGKQITISIKILTRGNKILHKELTNLTCEQGHAYTCKLKEKGNPAGIYTAEDFIAFTHLINNQPYRQRQLDEFGTIKNGQTTYYLNNDIKFTPEEREVLQIGCSEAHDSFHGFKDTFDGQGHCLEGFEILPGTYSFSGLFQKVLPNGCIKNLTVKNVQPVSNAGINSMAILCGENEGVIQNCRLENISLNLDKRNAGGLVAQNNGTIVNCYIENLHIKIKFYDKKTKILFGAIASCNGPRKKILNCGINHLTCEVPEKLNANITGICEGNLGIIENCVIDHYSPLFYPICAINEDFVHSCFYLNNTGSPKMVNRGEGSKKEVFTFNDNTEGRSIVTKYLNQWINKSGLNNYPQLTFLPWVLEKDFDITFDSH